jgi:environmental stress-induced protein Ves
MEPGIVRAADLRPRPWPNGLGLTRDLAAGNRGEGGFGWLLSIADLTGDAAFSHFAGCDRVFTLIEGTGVTLALEGRAPLPCLPWVPACFPGDLPTHCTMPAGSARAFNLFLDRARYAGQVSVRSIAASHAVPAPSRTVAIFCAEGALEIGAEQLQAGDTLLHSGAATIRAAATGAIAVIVEVTPSAAVPLAQPAAGRPE